MGFGKLALRVVVGGLFVGHGTQKLLGWFGGGGLDGTDRMMHSLDMYPVRLNSLAVGAAETVGGALLTIGLATPVAAGALTASMVTAIRKVHWKNGPFNANGGWELNALMIAAVNALVETGPGKVSVDALFGKSKWGAGWALAALAAGTAASAAAIEAARRETKNVPTVLRAQPQQ
jgi:putative oxidoreductase